MKNYFLALFFLTGLLGIAQQTSYLVKTGDTLESIAKVFRVSPNDIQNINPSLSQGLKNGMLLLIPSPEILHYNKQKPLSFSYHIVQSKETLFGLAQRFGISQDDIKRYNIDLYTQNLKQGKELTIPIYKEKNQIVTLSREGLVKYVVKPKEGIWRIAKKYGITQQELIKLNPNMPKILKEGSEIWVPSNSNFSEALTDEFVSYLVEKAEGFMSLERKFNLSKKELIALNPDLKNGIRIDTEIRIPKDRFLAYTNRQNQQNKETEQNNSNNYFRSNIRSSNVKSISFVLPFKVSELTDISDIKEKLQSDKLTAIAVDFYSGALFAIDSLEKMGFSFQVNVFDSQASEKTIKTIDKTVLEESQVIIGPFIPKVFNTLSERIDSAILLAPLSNKNIKSRANVFQTVPSQQVLQQQLINFVKQKYSDANILLLSDNKNTQERQLIINEFGNTTEINDIKSIKNHLRKYSPNLIFVSSNDVVFLSEVIQNLHSIVESNKKNQTFDIIMLTLDRSEAYDHSSISHAQLSTLKFTFASINKYADANDFTNQYYKTYKISPSKYALRGFDITMDAIIRLSTQGGFSHENASKETSYQENKFLYKMNKQGQGFENQGIYILQYDKLQAKEVGE